MALEKTAETQEVTIFFHSYLKSFSPHPPSLLPPIPAQNTPFETLATHSMHVTDSD